ncbi:MAG: CehA/McbA family metallohydrolase [Candidatus Sigynarchaeota archaeon]
MALMDDVGRELLMFLIWFLAMVGFVLVHYLVYAWISGTGKKVPVPDEALEYSYKPEFLPKDGYFIDLHSHTLASDGWMTPEQNIKWHIANNFHAFVLTDHNTCKNVKESLALQAKYPQVLIIPGYEWTSGRLHLNFIGIEDWPYPAPGENPTDDECEDAIKKAKALGAVVLVDHVTWTMDQPKLRSGELVHPTREQLLDWGVDGFEINNEMYWHDPLTLLKLEEWHHEWKGRKIFAGTGTDIHNPFKSWPTAWTQLLLEPDEREHVTIDVVKAALLQGRTKIWQNHDYRQPPEAKFWQPVKNRKLKAAFAPFLGTVEGARLVAVSRKEIASYIAWLLIAYVPVRLLFLIYSLF